MLFIGIYRQKEKAVEIVFINGNEKIGDTVTNMNTPLSQFNMNK